MVNSTNHLPTEADAIVVGSGPAGLSAAKHLRSLGVKRVLVLERERNPGGVPRHCGHSPYGLREFRRPMLGPAYALRLVAETKAAGAAIHTGATVTAIEAGAAAHTSSDDPSPQTAGARLTVTNDAGVHQIQTRAVLLATGTRETTRAGRLLGGTKPGGVLTTGALQNLVYGGQDVTFRRPVILGTELVAFSAILTCRHAGLRPVAMVEPRHRITARHPAQLLPRGLGIPLFTESDVAEIEGRSWVEAIHLTTPEGPARLAADALIVTGCFRPEATLARLSGLEIDPRTGGPVVDQGGRTTRPAIYAAGNLLRPVETAGWCWQEGRIVAETIARDFARGTYPRGLPLTVEGGALKYAVPQRISAEVEQGFGRLQLRVAAPAAGRLSLRVNGHEIAGRPLSALPERRLLLPLPPARGTLSVAFESP